MEREEQPLCIAGLAVCRCANMAHGDDSKLLRNSLVLLCSGVSATVASERTGIHVARIRGLFAQMPHPGPPYLLRRHANMLCGIEEECCWEESEMREAIWRVMHDKEPASDVLQETLLRESFAWRSFVLVSSFARLTEACS